MLHKTNKIIFVKKKKLHPKLIVTSIILNNKIYEID